MFLWQTFLLLSIQWQWPMETASNNQLDIEAIFLSVGTSMEKKDWANDSCFLNLKPSYQKKKKKKISTLLYTVIIELKKKNYQFFYLHALSL